MTGLHCSSCTSTRACGRPCDQNCLPEHLTSCILLRLHVSLMRSRLVAGESMNQIRPVLNICSTPWNRCMVTGIQAARTPQATAVVLSACAAAWTACAGTPDSALRVANCGHDPSHVLAYDSFLSTAAVRCCTAPGHSSSGCPALQLEADQALPYLASCAYIYDNGQWILVVRPPRHHCLEACPWPPLHSYTAWPAGTCFLLAVAMYAASTAGTLLNARFFLLGYRVATHMKVSPDLGHWQNKAQHHRAC